MIDEKGRNPDISIMKALENSCRKYRKLEDNNIQELLDKIVINFYIQPRIRFKFKHGRL